MARNEIRVGGNRLAVLSVTILLICASGLARAAADGYQDWLRAQRGGVAETERQYQAYRNEQDQQFSSHLKSQWQEFQVFQGKVRDPNPKPRLIPKAPAAASPPARVEPAPLDVPVKLAQLPKAPVSPAPTRPMPIEVAADNIDFSFYGNAIRLPYDRQWRTLRVGSINPKVLAAFWEQMSETRHQPTLHAMAQVRRDLSLDDWGHIALWRQLVKTLQPNQPTEQELLLWYFLVKAGVDVRLGYSGSQVFLFVAVRQPVYAASFIKMGKVTYYALLSPDRGKGLRTFNTYESNYPAALQPIDLSGASIAFTRTSPIEKQVNFEYQGRRINLKLAYDPQLVDYMASFPQMDFDLYFVTQGSNSAREPLLRALHQHLQGMREEEAVNFLLAFVQKAFAYQTDQDQFGYEKYFFVEEALHYPYSDCEDRSALFAWLVRELLGLKTVGLHYPGHMTTGVAVKNVPRNGASVEWQGERYVIADPTYINAGIGMAMPSYAHTKPLRVIATH